MSCGNFCCRITPTGIACFVGTRRLHRGDLEFWAACQPMFSDFCIEVDNITPPTAQYFNLAFYPGEEKDMLFDCGLTAQSLVKNEELRDRTARHISGIIDEYFMSGFSSDMTVRECLRINDSYTDMCLSRSGKSRSDWRTHTYVRIEMMLYLHIGYEICLDFYKSLTREWLCSAVGMQFTAENAVREEENSAFIERFIDSCRHLQPEECIKACLDSGMVLNSRFYDEQKFRERFNRAAKKYAGLMDLIESDDYDGILRHLEAKHNEGSEKCRHLFRCEPLSFSCYVK